MKSTVITICPKCNKTYTLGVNGVMNGCDECTGTVRNLPGGYIIIKQELAILNGMINQIEADNQKLRASICADR